MYESEVNDRVEDAAVIPDNVRARWGALGRSVTARSLISWGEHCTECAIPYCFVTCDLYEQRKVDLSCRRFSEGMARVMGVGGIVPWLLKIEFKQWAKLWADGSIGLMSVSRANRIEKINAVLGALVRDAPSPKRVKKSVAWRFRQRREKWAKSFTSAESPDYFLIEIYNPAAEGIALTLYIRSRRADDGRPFSARFTIPPGLHRVCFPVGTIGTFVNLSQPFHVEISPSESDARPLLYFGCVDFVRDSSWIPAKNPGSCKCVVWDLDNTVWDGILVEDGPDRISLKPGIREIFAELDRRGILLSVASKNNPEDVLPMLKRFGLDEYILKPSISWEPKGQAVKRIAQALNIGIDSLIYVDDSPFERAEVSSVCAEITVIDATDAIWLPWREECQVTVTAESARRRQMYREQDLREAASEQAGDDYEAFLRDCDIRVRVIPWDHGILPRVHELAQRTNQMNFSGTRYNREQLEVILADKKLEAAAIEVTDRFGDYGIVGLAIVDREHNRLTDLAFSCRIQSKRIEHACIAHLLKRFSARPFRALWRKTERNAPYGRVFADLGFSESGEKDGMTNLEFAAEAVPSFDFIRLSAEL